MHMHNKSNHQNTAYYIKTWPCHASRFLMSKEGKSVRQSGPVMANNNKKLETEKFTFIRIYFYYNNAL